MERPAAAAAAAWAGGAAEVLVAGDGEVDAGGLAAGVETWTGNAEAAQVSIIGFGQQMSTFQHVACMC
jgi:hypothetical protein